MEAIELLFIGLLLSFMGIFIYKLYKIFDNGEDYTLPKLFITTILGIITYGLAFLIFIAESLTLSLGYIIMFRFTTGFFILFFIFIFIDLFIGMKRFSAAAASNDNGLMLQRSNKGLGFKY